MDKTVATPDEKPLPPKTRGERYYDRMQFITGDLFIIASSAALAYVARFGAESYGGVRNYLKDMQNYLDKKLMKHIGTGGDFSKLTAMATSSTLLTMWGGNLFAPALKYLENNKEKIVTRYNEKHGTPEEVAAGHERLKDVPKQTWGDVIKGRAVGFVTVVGGFLGMYYLLGKSKTPTVAADGSSSFKWRLDQYEEKVGRWFAGITKEGRRLIDIPLSTALDATQAQNKAYRFGRMLALDVFAASAALLIWNVVSRFSAKSRASHSPSTSAGEVMPIHAEEEPNAAPTTNHDVPAHKIHAAHAQGSERLTAMPMHGVSATTTSM
jgi:hypothetical protein